MATSYHQPVIAINGGKSQSKWMIIHMIVMEIDDVNFPYPHDELETPS